MSFYLYLYILQATRAKTLQESGCVKFYKSVTCVGVFEFLLYLPTDKGDLDLKSYKYTDLYNRLEKQVSSFRNYVI